MPRPSATSHLTATQEIVLGGICDRGYDLSEAWDRFASTRTIGKLPHMLASKAFDRVIDSLKRRGLIEQAGSEWKLTDSGRAVVALWPNDGR